MTKEEEKRFKENMAGFRKGMMMAFDTRGKE
jgi:hypothetical protein